jgi:hypothetical protein
VCRISRAAAHSPILPASPGAKIYELDAPERYLRAVLEDRENP